MVPPPAGFVGRYLIPKAQYLLTDEGGQMVGAFAAVSEVIVCMMSPLVMVVQGARAAVLVFFYFQYVARRHAESYWTQQAVKALTDKADGERAPRCVRSRLSPAPCNFGLVPVLASASSTRDPSRRLQASSTIASARRRSACSSTVPRASSDSPPPGSPSEAASRHHRWCGGAPSILRAEERGRGGAFSL